MDDRALVHRMLRGEEQAFDEFFEANFDRLFRFAVRRTEDADAAEDVAQSTLITAVNKLDTWRGEAALFTWLCSICRRELLRHWERTGRQPRHLEFEDDAEGRSTLEQLVADIDGPERELERREVGALVQLTLDYLPGRYGDVLEWKYIEGFAVAEIAAKLGSTPKAVESMLTRARQAFREGFVALTRSREGI